MLVFRANRFINLAQGQMGSVASASLAVLVFRFHLPYWLALVLALALGAGTGALVERLLMWRLFDRSRLVLLVATIGISQLILLLVLAGPLKPDATATQRRRVPAAVLRALGDRQRGAHLEPDPHDRRGPR